MKYNLADICEYGKGKVDVAILDEGTYISTENMMPNRGGITSASSLPAMSQTQAFFAGDVLVSNIRPYFKKIWFAEFDGGCSNDVLVFRAKAGVSKRFLYYVLSDDTFFDYSMATSKGTKMPRGDKAAIMKYGVPDFTYEEQEKIAGILEILDRKIRLNTEINENLADLLQTIYQERFSDVSLASVQGNLSDLCTYSKDRVPISQLNASTYFSTENMLPGKAGATEATSLPTTQQTTACHKGDTLISNIRPYFKKIVYCEDECGCSTDVLCFTPTQSQYAAYLFSTLYADKFFAFMVAGSKGTKMPRGDKQQIMSYPVALPSNEELGEFNDLALPILTQTHSNRSENKRFSAVRDSLLPKLMSGELDVSALDL